MAKTSKTSGNKGSTAGKTPTGVKKPKATTAGDVGARVAEATPSTTAAAVKAKGTRPSAPATSDGTSHIAPTVITSEERHRLIAEAAYLLAEKRGFQGGNPQQDWYEAAAQIDQMIMGINKGSGT